MSKLPLFLLAALLALTASACSAGTGAANAPAAKTNAAAMPSHDSADAQMGTAATSAVIGAVRKLAPHATIQSIVRSPVAGLYQVVADGQVVYVSPDGRYLLNGNAYDLKTQTDLSDSIMNRLRRDALAKIAPDQDLVFAPANPKYTITVFTDIDCPYCRAFHARIAEYNKAGIAVRYLFWPRSGLDTPSSDKAVSAWCAADRKAAFTAATAGRDPKPAKCDNPVKRDYELGIALGVDGTPTIVAPDGEVIGGYADPEELLQRLRKAAAAPAKG